MQDLQNSLKNLRREPQASVSDASNTSSRPHFITKVTVGTMVVGAVIGNEFIKQVHSTKHFLHTPPAIAFDIDSLNKAQKFGATHVKIIDLDEGLVYITTIEQIFELGFRFNRGFGDQIGLTLKHWQCSEMEIEEPQEPDKPMMPDKPLTKGLKRRLQNTERC